MELYTENKNKHNKAVAEIMYENAEALGVDKEVAYAVGLLHDIGYIVNKTKHGELGADIVKRLGVKGDSVDAIRYHGTDPFEMLNKKKHKYISPMLCLLWFADQSVDSSGNKVGFDKRLYDIKDRYGEKSNEYKTSCRIQVFLQAVFAFDYTSSNSVPNLLPLNADEFINLVFFNENLKNLA